jgi:hypothetical protein
LKKRAKSSLARDRGAGRNRKEPEDLTRDEALACLFGLDDEPFSEWLSGATWPHWKKPRNALPIDEKIEALRGRKGRIGLRSKAELERLNGNKRFCPFFDVRVWIAYAVGESLCSNERQTAWREAGLKLKTTAKQLMAINAASAEVFRGANPFEFVFLGSIDGAAIRKPDLARSRDFVHSFLRAKQNAIALCSELRTAYGFIESEKRRISPASNRGNVWLQMFVEMLGYYWYFLTGKRPSTAPLFADFVLAAYQSLGGREIDLESEIKTVVKRVGRRSDSDDRFDRWEKRSQRPRMGQMIAGRWFMPDDFPT